MKMFLPVAAAAALVGIMTILKPAVSQADGPETVSFDLVPASDAIAACLPGAKAEVTVAFKEAILGVDTLRLHASGLPPNTTFAVFLTAEPVPTFVPVEYIGDFTTNQSGRGSLRVDAIIEEAFALVNGTHVNLNHVVFWFADPAADDVCFGAGGGPITPFDGDGEAGAAAMSSRNFLPGAPLP